MVIFSEKHFLATVGIRNQGVIRRKGRILLSLWNTQNAKKSSIVDILDNWISIKLLHNIYAVPVFNKLRRSKLFSALLQILIWIRSDQRLFAGSGSGTFCWIRIRNDLRIPIHIRIRIIKMDPDPAP